MWYPGYYGASQSEGVLSGHLHLPTLRNDAVTHTGVPRPYENAAHMTLQYCYS